VTFFILDNSDPTSIGIWANFELIYSKINSFIATLYQLRNIWLNLNTLLSSLISPRSRNDALVRMLFTDHRENSCTGTLSFRLACFIEECKCSIENKVKYLKSSIRVPALSQPMDVLKAVILPFGIPRRSNTHMRLFLLRTSICQRQDMMTTRTIMLRTAFVDALHMISGISKQNSNTCSLALSIGSCAFFSTLDFGLVILFKVLPKFFRNVLFVPCKQD
jgi:hypothetical protein